MKTIEGYDVKIFTDNVEQLAIDQIKKLLSIDVFSDKKIRIMPDVHVGSSSVIGFTSNFGDKVIPNIVGVDIGCGMRVIKFKYNGAIDYHAFNEHINANVPSGRDIREDDTTPLTGEAEKISREAQEKIGQMNCYKKLRRFKVINGSIGTLGGGNHFIELDRDDDGYIYLVIHTGSRNLGKQVAGIYQEQAIKHLAGVDDMSRLQEQIVLEYKAAGREKEIQTALERLYEQASNPQPPIPEEFCYLEGRGREDYLHDMRLCQDWAVLNRKLIATLLMQYFQHGAEIIEEFESVHNYISDDNIIRKGSISAAAGERCIIPMNMRDGSLICTGKGNIDWNCSAPHGAGRIMSRGAAHERIKMEDFEESMKGIYSECINEYTRDESPMVYKPAAEIMANISPTVNIDAIIRPIFNFKATK